MILSSNRSGELYPKSMILRKNCVCRERIMIAKRNRFSKMTAMLTIALEMTQTYPCLRNQKLMRCLGERRRRRAAVNPRSCYQV